MRRVHALFLIPIIAGSLPATATAASFYILESSSSRIGNAFAGTASAGDDASTLFFSGAAMTRLDEPTINIAGNAIFPDADFDNNGSTAATGTPLQRPLPGSDGNTDDTAVVPNLYFATPWPDSGDTISVGLGINAPFGLTTSYDDDWVGRYQATDSSLTTLNINPQIAFKPTERLSLGIGVNYQRIETELENEVDSFAACTEAAGGGSTGVATCSGQFGTAPANAFGNPDFDSSGTIEGDDDGVGLDLSLLYAFTDNTRVGLSWRQGISYTLDGDVDFDRSQACNNSECADFLVDGDVTGDVSLPDIVTASLTHRFNPDWRVDADIAWYEWDAIQEIRIERPNGQEVSTLDLQYEDTFRYAVGLTYSGVPNWDLRAGLGYDESPISSSDTVSPRIPDGDRTHIALGATYNWSERLSVDLGFLHVRVDSVDVDNEDEFGNTLKGEFDPTANVFTAGANWRF